MNEKYTLIISLFLVSFAALVVLQNVSAQEGPHLEEILNGFEDDEKSDDDLQDIMEGFEEEAGAVKSSEDLKDDEILEGFEDETKETEVVGSEKLSYRIGSVLTAILRSVLFTVTFPMMLRVPIPTGTD